MTTYDVFNGDADGICALQQLRLASPAKNTLVMGVNATSAACPRFSFAGRHRGRPGCVVDSNRDELVWIPGRGS